MGVLQAKLVSVQIIVFFLLASASLAAINPVAIPNDDGACCVLSTGDVEFHVDEEFAQGRCETLGAAYIETCFIQNPGGDNGVLVDPNIDLRGCCCAQGITSVRAVSTLEAKYDISELYCTEYLGNTFIGEQADCQVACAADETYYEVSGTLVLTNGTKVTGVSIRESGTDRVAQSTTNGEFLFSELFIEGVHEFSVEVPSNYPLICEQNKVVFENINSNTGTYSFTVELACNDREIPVVECKPIWEVEIGGEWKNLDAVETGGWGECSAQGFQRRVIRDARPDGPCDEYLYIPESARRCETKEEIQTCGNGVLDDGEQCDGNVFRVGSGSTTTNSYSCSTIRENYLGNIACTSSCAYDTTACVTACDCLTYDQCSNECQFECQDHESGICETCPNPVTFIPTDDNYNGDLFSLYDSDLTDGEMYPLYPIEYYLGTKDVTLNWFGSKKETCAADVLGYELIACKELEGGSGTCDPQATYTKSITGVGDNLHSYTFENILEEDSRFCYNVVTIRQSGRDSLYEEGSYVCFDTGDAMCMQSHAQGLNCLFAEENGKSELRPTQCDTYTASDEHVNLQLISDGFCNEGFTCVETEYEKGNSNKPGAVCEPQQICESCNGMFGMFADYGLDIQFASSGVLAKVSCEETVFVAAENEVLPGYGTDIKGQCFKEESDTLFSFYESCDLVNNCYDYKSRGTCGGDPCFKFTEVESTDGVIDNVVNNGCEWLDFDLTYEDDSFFGAEVGVGVCRPKVEDQQDCSLCNTDSPTGFCDQDICELYGSCFQKENIADYQTKALSQANNALALPACMNIGDLACILYDSADACLGAGDERSISKIDVLYEDNVGAELGPEDRIAGTNKQLSFSNDLLGFGDCSWDEPSQHCYKNSDEYIEFPELDDCLATNPDSIACYKDVTPPSSTIFLTERTTEDGLPLYGADELVSIPFSIEDDFSTYEEVTTYVSVLREACVTAGYIPCMGENEGVDDESICLSSTSSYSKIKEAYLAGCYIYPQQTIDELSATIFDQEQNAIPANSRIIDPNGGEHRLLFFSEDKAKNLEVLQERTIYVDSVAPQIEIVSVDKTVRNINEDEYYTDVEITATISEHSFCQAKLVNEALSASNEVETVIPFNTDFEATPIGDKPFEFTTSYTQLDDGDYMFVITCIDDLNNDNSERKPITLNADAAIKVLSPLGVPFKNATDVVLEISTLNSATCKFDKTNSAYDSSTAQEFTMTSDRDEEGRIIHRANYGDFYKDDSSGLYMLAISCDFSGVVTEKRKGDFLYFGIDDVAPKGIVSESNKNYDSDLAEWIDQRTLEITCDDASEQTPLYYFGCKEIHYCLSKDKIVSSFEETTCLRSEIINADEDKKDVTAQIFFSLEDQFTYLHYYFVDKEGATSSVKSLNTKIRDGTTFNPIIEIY